MQLRIFTYKVTFEEIPHWYWGVHKEKKINDGYLGSPVTHDWMWEFYTPHLQVLEVFPYTEEGWREAHLLEDRIIKPDINNPLCLNESYGSRVSRSASQRGGYAHKGVPKTPEHKAKIGKGLKGKRKTKEHCETMSKRHKGKVLSPEVRKRISDGVKRARAENPGISEKMSLLASKRRWFWHPVTMETRHTEESPGPEWREGRPISYLGAPWWTDGVKNKRSFVSPGPEWVRGISNDPRKKKFRCAVTGHISSSGGLTKYQNSRGIDPSNRVLVD